MYDECAAKLGAVCTLQLIPGLCFLAVLVAGGEIWILTNQWIDLEALS